MAIDPSIALQIRPPQLDDPLTVQSKQLQLRDLMGQQQMRQMQLADAQRTQQAEMTLADLYREAAGDATKIRTGLAERGLGSRIPAFDEQQAKIGKATNENEAAKFKLAKEKLEASGAALSSLIANPQVTHQDVIGTITGLVQRGVIDPQQGQDMVRALPGRPEALRGFLMQKGMEVMDASKRIEMLTPKTGTIDAGNRVIPTQTNQVTGEVAQGQPIVKAPEGFNVGPDGRLSADPGYLDAKRSIAAAGKTSVNLNVNTAKELGAEMATGLGKQLDASLAGAQSATTSINTADQIRRLAGSGKVITGPGADARLVLTRIGDALGVAGADTKEKLANTAALVQNLAKTELEAAQSMKGQGQITESERAILRRAASGDLNMSPAELMTLAGGIDKTARARIKAHKVQVDRMVGLQGAAPLMPFYNVDEPAPPAQAPSGVVDWGSLR